MDDVVHFADRFYEACDRKGGVPICVGLDPVYERLPASVREQSDSPLQAIVWFCRQVIDIVGDHVPCVKIQSACFERYLGAGVNAYHVLVHEARSEGMLVIGDAKRGDIGVSASHYAAGCLADHVGDPVALPGGGPDALTINAYFGADGMQPFVEVAKEQSKGLFALVRTSNPGGDALQALPLAEGGNVAGAVARMVADLGEQAVSGQSGYSLLGAVVGATKPDEAAELRRLMPKQIFLVPGFGAQGGSADDVRALYNADGRGAMITASRSILYAYEKRDGDWKAAIRDATLEMKHAIAAITA